MSRMAYIIIAQTGDRATAHFYRAGNVASRVSGSPEQILAYRTARDAPVIRYDLSEDVPLMGDRGIFSLPECEEVDLVATGEARAILEHLEGYKTVPTVKDYIAEVKARGYHVETLSVYRAWARMETTAAE